MNSAQTNEQQCFFFSFLSGRTAAGALSVLFKRSTQDNTKQFTTLFTSRSVDVITPLACYYYGASFRCKSKTGKISDAPNRLRRFFLSRQHLSVLLCKTHLVVATIILGKKSAIQCR